MNDQLAAYESFLRGKAVVSREGGFSVERADLHPSLFEFQKDMVLWALRRGRALIAASFGLGKTRIQIELLRQAQRHTGKSVLVICPLGVKHQFIQEDGPAMGVEFAYVRTDEEALVAKTPFLITNYERVRDGNITAEFLSTIGAVCLDEGAILGNLGTKTQDQFNMLLAEIPYRWVATATPAPNDYRQLIYFADFLDAMDAGQALAQPLDAKVLTPSGWTHMGNIAKGDEVIAVDGTSTRVLGVYPQGMKPIYKVTFSDGSSTECTEEHLWLTRNQYERNNERRYRQRNENGNDGSRNGQFATVKMTGEIAESLKSSSGGLNHEIPLVGIVEFEPRRVAIDPYLLGALLGDGHIRRTSVNICSADQWIVDTVREIAATDYGLAVGRVQEIRSDGRISYDYSISSGHGKGSGGGRGHFSNGLLNGLRNYDLLEKRAWNKRVPADYLFNSPDVRLAVLQGLMDTDGSIDEANRTISFVTTSNGLADDIRFLVRSLGGIATINRRMPHQGNGQISGRRVQGWREQFKVTINLPAGINPFRLPRKAQRVIPKTKYVPVRYITAIEPIGAKQARCIAIDHPSHLYVTDDFIVTHNTRFFGRNPDKAGDLQLMPHMEQSFWLWVASWCLFTDKPGDLGYSDDGYIMPDLGIHWHRIAADHQKAWNLSDQNGQRYLLKDTAAGVTQAMKEKRDSLQDRVAKALDIIGYGCGETEQLVVWCDLNDEQTAIEHGLKDLHIDYSSIHGSLSPEAQEERLYEWKGHKTQVLIAKAQMLGSGVNLQQCHVAIYVGLNFKFRDFIQSVHRLQRYGQLHKVEIHCIHTDAEDGTVDILLGKWAQHDAMVARMRAIVQEYGLTNEALVSEMRRSLGVTRQERHGQLWTAINNDTVLETMGMADNSIDEIVSSVPFGNHYEYIASLNDFGHNPTDNDFWVQMDFLIPELLRVLKPGRMCCIHAKDRLLYGHQTPHGMMEVDYFTHDCARAFRKHGFVSYGEIFIPTDVVRENNSTNRLGWSENAKDGSKMGVGLSEKVLLFRKPQTDKSRSYADEPVRKDKKSYSRGRWQIDAHSLWRSNGQALPTPADNPELLQGMDGSQVFNWYKQWSKDAPYDYQQHVAFNEAMGDRLPAKFMLMPPQAPAEYEDTVWTDVLFFRTLNMSQAKRRVEKHICPLPLDIVERLIVRYSNPDELIFDPFSGLGTVPFVALKQGRRSIGTELNPTYFDAFVRYCQEAEAERQKTTLFDLEALAPA